MFKRPIRPVSASVLTALLVATGCIRPFSELQSARLAGPGKIEVTPTYSTVSGGGSGGTDKVQDEFGVAVAAGVSKKVDIRVRYYSVHGTDDGSSAVNIISAGPKVSLVPDRLALSLPVGFAFGTDVNASKTVEFHPALIGTIPLSKGADVSGSFKVLVPTYADGTTLVAYNLGMGLSSDLSKWAIRPEIGILRKPNDSGHFMHASVGFSWTVK